MHQVAWERARPVGKTQSSRVHYVTEERPQHAICGYGVPRLGIDPSATAIFRHTIPERFEDCRSCAAVLELGVEALA